ncbi:YgiT-type zinc finger protein [Geminicoccus roseus]|uniref:YgiT-type zinc finger protein n=1 Tax=Geminicoccus roseus TaxID=404900 RepID=UPI0004224AEA|nr:YgiT-type zinc finger protein [Geminicoccus roseus]
MLCPYCQAGLLRADSVTIAIRRAGRIVEDIQVPAWRCRNCGERSFADDAVDQAVQALEASTEPGDDIVLIDEGEAAGSA